MSQANGQSTSGDLVAAAERFDGAGDLDPAGAGTENLDTHRLSALKPTLEAAPQPHQMGDGLDLPVCLLVAW